MRIRGYLHAANHTTMRFLYLSALALVTSCSLQLDSQYGIRIEPAPKGPQDRQMPKERPSTPVAEAQTESSAWTYPEVSQIAVRDEAWSSLSEQPREALNEPDPPQTSQSAALAPAENPEFDAVSELNSNLSGEVDALPKTEPNMLTAWLMWGIPVVLMLAGVGFLLNFGLHWYYLGKQRRANSATFIWALTLAGYVAAGLLRFLKLGLLALLVLLIVLIPLMVIQLIRAVKDAVLLNKMASRMARRTARKRGPSI